METVYEYKIVQRNENLSDEGRVEAERFVNGLADQGWDLVSNITIGDLQKDSEPHYIGFRYIFRKIASTY